MLRVFSRLALLVCIISGFVLAASAGETAEKDVAPQRDLPRTRAAEGDADLVRLEILIADLREDDVGKDVLSDVAAAPKALVERLAGGGKLNCLTRVQLVTLDGQEGSLQVGQRVPRIVGSQRTPGGQSNSVTMENVGMRLSVKPRLRDDGMIVLEIQIERSQLGPADEGAVIAKPSEGEPIRVSSTETFTAQTTVSARSGQSVLVGGLMDQRQDGECGVLVVVTPEASGSNAPQSTR